jgi:hypothetical protein
VSAAARSADVAWEHGRAKLHHTVLTTTHDALVALTCIPMGASDSKLTFKQGVFRLSEPQEIAADDAYWTGVCAARHASCCPSC